MPRLTLADLGGFDPAAPPPRGEEQRFCCPLPACAEKPRDAAHRTLCVNVTTGMWTCQRCHGSGRLEESREPPSRAARDRRLLREAFYVPPPAPQPDAVDLSWRKELKGLAHLVGTPGASWLGKRRIMGCAHESGVRYSPNWYGHEAVVFPIRDREGKLVAAQGRYLDNEKPKTRDAGPKGAGVFATPGAWEADPLVLVEGPADALSLAAAGYPSVALMGCSASDIVAWSCALRRVAVALDADDAGDAAAAKLLGALDVRGARAIRLRPAQGKDWNDMLLELGPDALGREVAGALASELLAVVASDSCAVSGSGSLLGHSTPGAGVESAPVASSEPVPEWTPEEQAVWDETRRLMATSLSDGDLIRYAESFGARLGLKENGCLKVENGGALPPEVREEVTARQRLLVVRLKKSEQ